MGNKHREKIKSESILKYQLDLVFQFISLVVAGSGIMLLLWCGYKMENPFPYASYIGASLAIFGTILAVFTDNSKWSNKRSDYPKDLGGNRGGG